MKNKEILLWVAGFAGVLLLVAAYKNKSVISILGQFGGTGTGKATAAGDGVTVIAPASGGQYPGLVGSTFDANGLATDVPDAYSFSPGTYVPSQTGN